MTQQSGLDKKKVETAVDRFLKGDDSVVGFVVRIFSLEQELAKIFNV